MITVGIPVRNQLVYLHRAVNSVLKHRSLPTSLVIVDDASAAPTARWLDRLSGSHGEEAVTVIRNRFREGFAYNANLVLDAAETDMIVLLNSDTVVTPGWDDALQQALTRTPRAGLAGPSTSCAHTPQVLSECRFGRFELPDSQIEEQGRDVALRYRDQWETLKHLGGFCYAISRPVFRDVGYFDERFGLGPYEENDYSDRALEKGYRCIWAKDSYVHHFGGRTFEAEGVEHYPGLQQQAKEFYHAKRNGTVAGEWVRRQGEGKLNDFIFSNKEE